jgi:hypothetical protein
MRTRIELPRQVTRPYEVFVNGVPQVEGTDFEPVGSTLFFNRPLAREGKLGLWRWALIFFGVAGTYRKNDSVDVVFTLNGRHTVVSLAPVAPELPSPETAAS